MYVNAYMQANKYEIKFNSLATQQISLKSCKYKKNIKETFKKSLT